MMALLLLAASAAELDTLDQAVARCDRGIANAAFSSEAGRRSQFLIDAFREQEAIVAARLEVAERRRALREATDVPKPDAAAVQLESAALDDRQHALNDRRLLEGIRQDAIDAMRRYFLLHCPVGRTGK